MNHQDNASIKPKIWAVIPAAGVGRRMGNSRPKQYLQLNGRSILEHSLEKLFTSKAVEGVAIGIAANDEYWGKLAIRNEKLLGSYVGGDERINTVLNGLRFLSKWAARDDWVMVHDAVRPCVSVKDINLLVDKAMQSNRSAILASPVIDTVKRLNSDGTIECTLNRDELILALTPQLFPYSLLQNALGSAVDRKIHSTDESAAVEMLGEKPLAVMGCRTNIKITTIEDLTLANILLGDRDCTNQEHS